MSLILTTFFSAAAWAEDIKSPQAHFENYDTNIADIPADWASNNPILRKVCFNLIYPVNSREANAFLRDLHRTISALDFELQVQIERTIYPVTESYCVSLSFPDWKTSRQYENSPAFLDFYTHRWKPAVIDVSEQLSVLDTASANEN